MPNHDLIVVGGSAGGIEALTSLVAGLPADLPAAVCVAVHLRPYGESRLTEVLARASTLPVVPARNGMALRPGTIHVAVPDVHLLVGASATDASGTGVIRLVRGPRENRNRPAIDPLFRSAALAFGSRVIAVVLSGALDDGTAGAWAVRDRGGIVVVQEPSDAPVSSMPQSAISEVGADHVVPARELGALLGRLARTPVEPPRESRGASGAARDESDADLAREVAISAMDEVAHQREERYGDPSRFGCPDCGGVLWDVGRDGPLRFRCETGHAYAAASLNEAQTESVESALWAALRALEDRIALARLRTRHAEERGLTSFVSRFTVEEDAAQQHAATLRALLRLDSRMSIRPREHATDTGASSDLASDFDPY